MKAGPVGFDPHKYDKVVGQTGWNGIMVNIYDRDTMTGPAGGSEQNRLRICKRCLPDDKIASVAINPPLCIHLSCRGAPPEDMIKFYQHAGAVIPTIDEDKALYKPHYWRAQLDGPTGPTGPTGTILKPVRPIGQTGYKHPTTGQIIMVDLYDKNTYTGMGYIKDDGTLGSCRGCSTRI